MSASDVWLATAGEDVKLWDAQAGTLCHQFNPHSESIASLCWSHDNSFIVSACTAGDKICLSYANDNFNSVPVTGTQGISCIGLSSESRFLAGAGTSGNVVVWDVKSGRIKKTFDKPGHKAIVTCVEFGFRDATIASGSLCGDIILYNTATGQGFSPLQTPSRQVIRQLQFSRFRRSLLSAASDDGAVYLWDTNTKTLSRRFDVESGGHRAPCMGLVFSPCNQMLLVSVGLDKAVICYDVTANKVIKNMANEDPLTSVDLHNNGWTLTVGTSRGRVWMYDLRKTSMPVSSFAAHRSSVSHVRFKSNVAGDKGTGIRPSSTPVDRGREVITQNMFNNNASESRPITTEQTMHPFNSDDVVTIVEAKIKSSEAVSFSGVISPPHDLPSINVPSSRPLLPGNIPSSRSAVPVTSVTQPSQTANRLSAVASSNLGNDSFTGSIFSPLNDEVTPRDLAAADLNRMSFSTFPVTVPSSTECTSTANKRSVQQLNQQTYSSPSVAGLTPEVQTVRQPEDQPVSVTVRQSPLANQKTPVSSSSVPDRCASRVVFDSQSTEPTLYQPLPGRSLPSQKDTSLAAKSPSREFAPSSAARRTVLDASGNAGQSSARARLHNGVGLSANINGTGAAESSTETATDDSGDAAGNYAAWGAAGDATMQLPPYLLELVRNTVREEIEESAEMMRQCMLRFHADMLKQFYVLQMQTKEMLREYSVNPDLVAEIERLRAENERLRKNF